MITTECAIVGGGIAGLCAARRLLELQISPLIIEAGTYPSHKVCGEFLSPHSVNTLRKWDIAPVPLHSIHLHTPSKSLKVPFPHVSGSLSHMTLDLQLAEQISGLGGTLLLNTRVDDFSIHTEPAGLHSLRLSSGQTVLTKHLFIATGRLNQSTEKKQKNRFVGCKAHFSGIDLQSTLHMFSFPGAYLGIVPVENQIANVACLAQIAYVQRFASPQAFMEHILHMHPILSRFMESGTNLFNGWMEAYAPTFGLRETPNWPRTYWIGDASGTIPPASGNGLSLAIKSGGLAAEYAVRNDPMGFKHAWRKYSRRQIAYGKGLHHLFLSPQWCDRAISIDSMFPGMGQRIFAWTRDKLDR